MSPPASAAVSPPLPSPGSGSMFTAGICHEEQLPKCGTTSTAPASEGSPPSVTGATLLCPAFLSIGTMGRRKMMFKTLPTFSSAPKSNTQPSALLSLEGWLHILHITAERRCTLPVGAGVISVLWIISTTDASCCAQENTGNPYFLHGLSAMLSSSKKIRMCSSIISF